jgi:hypothetical protein
MAEAPASCIPPGGSKLWTIWTSMAGASFTRRILVGIDGHLRSPFEEQNLQAVSHAERCASIQPLMSPHRVRTLGERNENRKFDDTWRPNCVPPTLELLYLWTLSGYRWTTLVFVVEAPNSCVHSL